jgi:hypothetical protein
LLFGHQGGAVLPNVFDNIFECNGVLPHNPMTLLRATGQKQDKCQSMNTEAWAKDFQCRIGEGYQQPQRVDDEYGLEKLWIAQQHDENVDERNKTRFKVNERVSALSIKSVDCCDATQMCLSNATFFGPDSLSSAFQTTLWDLRKQNSVDRADNLAPMQYDREPIRIEDVFREEDKSQSGSDNNGRIDCPSFSKFIAEYDYRTRPLASRENPHKKDELLLSSPNSSLSLVPLLLPRHRHDATCTRRGPEFGTRSGPCENQIQDPGVRRAPLPTRAERLAAATAFLTFVRGNRGDGDAHACAMTDEQQREGCIGFKQGRRPAEVAETDMRTPRIWSRL